MEDRSAVDGHPKRAKRVDKGKVMALHEAGRSNRWIADEMEKDYQECRRMAQSRNDGKDCNTCSWRPVEIEDTGLCEWPEVIRQMDRDIVEESGDDCCNQIFGRTGERNIKYEWNRNCT